MKYLGLSGGYYHDASACVVENNQLLAFVEEERIIRRRYAENCLPNWCIETCFKLAGCNLQDIDVVALSWNPFYPVPKTIIDSSSEIVKQLLPENKFGKIRAKVVVVDHQLSHASTAYRSSGFDDALVISADGSGDGRSLAIYHGVNGEMSELESFDITQSLGWFYQRVTTFLNIGHWQNAGKTMGLAAYGTPCFTFPFLSISPNQGFRFDYPKEILPPKDKPLTSDVRSAFYAKQKKFLWQHFSSLSEHHFSPPRSGFKLETGERVYEEPTSFSKNLAASAQFALEEALISIISKYLNREKTTSLCLSGGVIQNCKAVGEIVNRFPYIKQLYVPPFAGDAGGSLGAVMEAAYILEGKYGRVPLEHAYWGPGFEDDQIKYILNDLGLQTEQLSNPSQTAAEMISDGKVIGWFQGKMESGPRALGARSILALPNKSGLKDRINKDIKNRESWRPFSPSVKDKSVVDKFWGNASFASPFMTVALKRKSNSNNLEGVCHIDGTSRVQLLDPTHNPRYAKLISEVGLFTGLEMVLNTSLNGRDQPIACTPVDAVRTFYTTGLDGMVIGSTLLKKDKK